MGGESAETRVGYVHGVLPDYVVLKFQFEVAHVVEIGGLLQC